MEGNDYDSEPLHLMDISTTNKQAFLKMRF